MNRRLRMYEPIWLSLKEHKSATISCPPRLHKRLVKAVIKEKWMDDKFKNKEGWRMMWLTYSVSPDSPDQITFRLSYKLTEIMTKDL
jgi:hypothetical protein